jgi:thiol-disulfide isomerase/thioredoxin
MKVLKFGAIWCKECLIMKPMWEEIESEILELKTEYFDADENSEVLKQYDVKDIPVFIFLDKDENEILRLEGAQNKEELVKIVKENLDN